MTNGRLAQEKIAPDEAQTIERFKTFIKDVMDKRATESGGARRRFNQTRGAGCVDAELTVPANLTAQLKAGFFASPGTYRARRAIYGAMAEYRIGH